MGRICYEISQIRRKTDGEYADELIVLSEGTRDYFKKTYGRETVFIPNGIDVQNEKKADIITKKYGLEKERIYIVSCKNCSGKRNCII